MSNKEINNISLNDLYFDPENPRFASYDYANIREDKDTILKTMIEDESVIDLVQSIGSQGFFPGEPLLICPIENESNKFYVVEGNRRLAALKILSGQVDNLLKPTMKEIVATSQHRPSEIPCLKYPRREDILDYLGYRHITGVKAWGALEKAMYLGQLERKNKESLGLTGDDLYRFLAKQIGSTLPAVKKSLTALNVYNKAWEAGKHNSFFSISGLLPQHIKFGVLYTALNYQHICSYIGLSSSDDLEQEDFNNENGKDLFTWLFYVNPETKKTIVGESRNLSRLDAVLGNEKSRVKFVESLDLDLAYNLSKGPEDAFNISLFNLKKYANEFMDMIENENKNRKDNLQTITCDRDQQEMVYKISRQLRDAYEIFDDLIKTQK